MGAMKFTVIDPSEEPTEATKEVEVDGHAIERRDPYHNWWFKDTLGSKNLSGCFTSLEEVKKAIFRHDTVEAGKKKKATI